MKFLNKNFPIFCLIISVSIFFYTFYKSIIIFSGEKNDFYLAYYIASFLLIFFSIILFFLKEKIREYLIILFFSFLVSIYLFEVVLTFKPHLVNFDKKYKKKNLIEFDKRDKKKIYEDLKKINENIVLTVSPDIFLNSKKKAYNIFPFSNISNAKTIHCNENGYYSIYKSDRYGFNNPDYEWDQITTEYLLVGDSFTHGACVNRPNDISSQLRILSKKSVINLGSSGNGPLIEYATLREYLNKNVKKVLWLYYKNDLNDLKKELSNKILLNYLNDPEFTQNLKFKQSQIDALKKGLILVEKKNKNNFFKILNVLKLNFTRSLIYSYLPEKYKYEQPMAPEFKEILRLAKELTELNNIKFYFVYLPSFNFYKYKHNTGYNAVKDVVNELQIPFIDLHMEFFSKQKNPLIYFPFGLKGHYNVEGYKKVSEIIFNKTKN
tara:strand:- start:761 stop:2068 length:1308 start_codon:yes stop_codon:yes gene_type:complete